MKENKFIEKFKFKNKTELESIINKPDKYNFEAVSAAKFILDNYSGLENSLNKEKNYAAPIFKEKAFFKNKWIYRFSIVYALFATSVIIFTYKLPQAYIYAIWSIINGLILIVLLSKHKNTLYYLKILSTICLGFVLFRYIDTYIIHSNANEGFKIEKKDLRYVVVYLVIILAGDQLIETRTIQINQ